jgi:gliding motility-associated-like protein
VVYPLPDATFSLKTLGSNNQFTLVKLKPAKLGYTSYLWQLPDGSSSNIDTPTMQFPRFFKDYIQLKVVNSWGCEDTAKLFFYVFPPLNQLWIENAFTPNNDNLNDVFKPGDIDGVLQYHLSVFNRWGELMFKSDTIENGWDGTYKGSEVQDGVYIFTLDLIYADGNRYHAKGNVTLTR